MRSPAFPPRRPSHIVRYVFPIALLLCIIYYLSSDSDRLSVPTAPILNMHPAPASHDAHDAHDAPDANPAGHVPIEEHPPSPPMGNQLGGASHLEEASGAEKDKGKEGQIPIGKLMDESSKSEGGLGNAPGDSGKTTKEKPNDSKGQSKPQQGGSSYDSSSDKYEDDYTAAQATKESASDAADSHPIDELIRLAESNFKEVLAKESTTLAQAADAYRKRRGRHPPPGFDQWFQFAQENDAIVVEDFFDRIYHDLNPFWGLDPKVIRKEAWDFEMTINIRNHNASAQSDWFWTQIWLKMIKTIEHLLPDMDIALNAMDEPRLVVPWEDVASYMKKAERTRQLVPTREVVSEFQDLPSPDESPKKPATRKKDWEDTKPFWAITRRGCAPDSPARRLPIVQSYDKTPAFSPEWAMPHQYQGYVSNFSLSTEFCHQPDLQALEGIFIHPLTTSSTQVLFPLFGGSKLATNNEILLPAPMYWNEEERFTGGDDHGPKWEDKISPLIWRGVATGGRNEESNWRGFQRHRFVAMSNGTQVALAEAEVEPPTNFELPSATYDLMASKENRLGEWISQWADVGFTEYMCDPDYKPEPEEGTCPYVEEHFELTDGVSLADQFTYKYLPDIDGNSFSGRYLGFLRSTGVPIKSTLWHEWHDSRLIAWKHFVPMDNRFGDFYGIMEYFLGYGKVKPAHDAAAKQIAMDGKAWAERVLRKEDMQIYVLRLLLEYARVSDDRREKMGWVGDLKS
ncbi:glycosyltransferase family 90 protein [Nemania sp. FL0916]|nr:glycosyltransferase family 90 protein [Nemania sp. FL0916]